MHCKTGKETKKGIQNASPSQSQAAPKRIQEMFPDRALTHQRERGNSLSKHGTWTRLACNSRTFRKVKEITKEHERLSGQKGFIWQILRFDPWHVVSGKMTSDDHLEKHTRMDVICALNAHWPTYPTFRKSYNRRRTTTAWKRRSHLLKMHYSTTCVVGFR